VRPNKASQHLDLPFFDAGVAGEGNTDAIVRGSRSGNSLIRNRSARAGLDTASRPLRPRKLWFISSSSLAWLTPTLVRASARKTIRVIHACR
jgi:hypothetical protein